MDQLLENAIPEEKKNDFMWILQNRIFRIFNVITQYGEDNFYLSFSGGKDSTCLSALIDMAIPGNKIPRVYADTGIELNKVREFVEIERDRDHPWELIMLKPKVPIKKTLEAEGYPFKSKKHSAMVDQYQRKGYVKGQIGLEHYLHVSDDGVNWSPQQSCPKRLEYQFTPEFQLRVSGHCCLRLKEQPLDKWKKENNRPISILGIMRAEQGIRKDALCTVFRNGKLQAFQPLAPVSIEWEDWFINKYNVQLCELYYPPYNFERTGCKGCPFNINLQEELETLSKYLPSEREQCEVIWKPVYDEYRRLGYRLKQEEQIEFSDDDFK